MFLDIGAQSYRYPSRITSRLNSYADALNDFEKNWFKNGATELTWGKRTLKKSEYNKKALEVVLPDIPISQKAQKVFEDFKKETEKIGIEVWYVIGE